MTKEVKQMTQKESKNKKESICTICVSNRVNVLHFLL